MQAVILAAGKGTRMRHLTLNRPKPLLPLLGKTLLEHKLDALPPEIREVIIVVGYLGDEIKKHLGNFYHGRTIRYAEDTVLHGTAKALFAAKDLLKDSFLVMMGDDVYRTEDMKKLMEKEWAVLVKKNNGEFEKGANVVAENGLLKEITEGVVGADLKFFNTGLYMLQKVFFNYEPVKLPGREEWGLPQTLCLVAKHFPVSVIETDFWLQISSPEDIARAGGLLLAKPT